MKGNPKSDPPFNFQDYTRKPKPAEYSFIIPFILIFPPPLQPNLLTTSVKPINHYGISPLWKGNIDLLLASPEIYTAT